MKLPRNNRQLKEIFRKSTAPLPVDFHGEYVVDMLTVFPSFKRFSHRKVFYQEDGNVSGHNVLFHKIWGRFFVEEAVCTDVDSGNIAVINYNRTENLPPVRRIRDHIRCVEKDTFYIGRFHYSLLGRLYFLGYFSLEKIKEGPGNPVPAARRLP